MELEGFIRVSVGLLAELAEAKDKGALPSQAHVEETASEEEGYTQDPLYLACFQACIMGDTRLEPILVFLSSHAACSGHVDCKP